ncbi:MAG: polyribonucleotide nucleotidyltransferase [Candidatus Spechtbacterales bacterium]
MEKKEYSFELGGRKLTLEFLPWAEQANASVIARYGDTVVLSAVTMGNKDVSLGYFPLTVEYSEKYYAAGILGGGRFYKREAKPSTDATLRARMVDRTLRPLFNQKMRREVQVVNSVLSYDPHNTPDIISFIAASTALHISDIPWGGPIGAVRVAKIGDELVLNPSNAQQEEASLNVTLAGAHGNINMIEVDAKERPEQEIMEALTFGARYVEELSKLQETIRKEIGKEKQNVAVNDLTDELKANVRQRAYAEMKEALLSVRHDHVEIVSALKDTIMSELQEQHSDSDISPLWGYLDELGDEIVHEGALKENKRVDGRAMDEIRPLSAQVSLLPRAHGSGLFMRGLTHVLTATTLGVPGDEEIHDDMEGEYRKRFMHHYNFPPFSTGETGFFRGPGRRELGHGALAEKALHPLLPDENDFPYVTRLVSEVLSSNGSSSMGSVCASSLALMDAGVPIKRHIAGIAMGLMSTSDGADYRILTDIQGPEDHHGDMDLKVAGTSQGVTAMQMDVKINGVSLELLEKAFAQAKTARQEILQVLEGAIAQPREGLSPYAPLIKMIQIKPARIGRLIGSGGSTIKEIMAETETEINVEDDGRVFISGTNAANVERAAEWAYNLTREIELGEQFHAKVTKIAEFGAFVELVPGQEALVHVSELSDTFVKDVHDIVNVDDWLDVKVIRIDEQGKIAASAKQASSTLPKGEPSQGRS